MLCCICVAELSYLSPSLCWSLHCGLHSWSKTTHSICWHQLPWQELKGVNKHCVSKPGNRGKKQLTSQSFGCADKQSQGAHTSEICGAWAALPGKIAQGRGKCANWATMSAAHVSVWPLHLWEHVGVAWWQQWELKPEIQGAELQNRRTDFISTHTGQTERLQDEHASLSSSVAAAAARAEYVLSCNQLETFKLHMSDEANSSYFTGLMPLISNWTYRPESGKRQSNTSWLPHLIYVAWYQSCIRLSSQCVDLTLGTNCSSCYTLQL